MATDIIARGMAAGADAKAQRALDQMSHFWPPPAEEGTYILRAVTDEHGFTTMEWILDTTLKTTESVVSAVSATVSGLGSENPESVTFIKDNNFTAAGLGVEEITVDGDVFIKIPTMYRKINTVVENQITSYTISNTKVDNTYEPYPVFIDEDGVTVMPYVLIGKYWNTSTSSLISSTETTSAAYMVLADNRLLARNRGTGYQLYDWMFWKLWQDLEIVLAEKIDINAGTSFTYDSLGIYWATVPCWVDGISHNGGTLIVSSQPTKYTDEPTINTVGYYSIGYSLATTSNSEIKALGYDTNHPFVNMPNIVINNSNYNTYYCDGYFYNSSGSRPITTAVCSTGSPITRGAFFVGGSDKWNNGYPGRLCYRPVSA